MMKSKILKWQNNISHLKKLILIGQKLSKVQTIELPTLLE